MNNNELTQIIRQIADMLPMYVHEGWGLYPDNLRCDVAFAKQQLHNLLKQLERENGTDILR